MLCVNNYTQEYIDACRGRIQTQLDAYGAVANAATGSEAVEGALHTFEPHFFNNMVLVLEGSFVHRARAKEKKDGNPLNEVRMLSNSLMVGEFLWADKSINYKPEKSVLKYNVGDEIKLLRSDFERLAEAFFKEIEAKYL
ncbi:MAG: hypothetical protein KC910_24000 [Candidatus Eremiobacteraeota bacterium]|nr:hypothetical protein [Candidatus Eremiobacteraeota bacterium]